MAMYIDTRYDGFMATVTVKSDTIGEIDLYDPAFRIDFIDQLNAAEQAVSIQELYQGRVDYESMYWNNLSKAFDKAAYSADVYNKNIFGSVITMLNDYKEDITTVGAFVNWLKQSIADNKFVLDEIKNNSSTTKAELKELNLKGEREFKDALFYQFPLMSNGQVYDALLERLEYIKNENRYEGGFNPKDIDFNDLNKLPKTRFQYEFMYINLLLTNKDDENYPKGVKTEIDKIEKGYEDEQGKHVNGIEDYIDKTNNPFLTITNKIPSQGRTYEFKVLNEESAEEIDVDDHNDYKDTVFVKPDVYCSADYDTLLKNGMQYWVNEDRKSITFRFIPRNGFQTLICNVAFNDENVTRFDVCLIPRLITGDIEKYEPEAKDPVLGEGSYAISSYDAANKEIKWTTTAGELPRPDFEWNSELDKDHFYTNTNTTPGFSGKQVPMYICKSSAYNSKAMEDGAHGFDWTKFRSDLYDIAAQTAIDIPCTINGIEYLTGKAKTFKPTTADVTIIEGYSSKDPEMNNLNKINLNLYEIIQKIYTSAEKPSFSQNQLRCVLEI